MHRYLLTLLMLLQLPAYAAVVSETVYFLNPDGHSYLLARSIHSDSPSHRFHVDKSVQLNDLRHVSPATFDWDEESSDKVNSLSFEAGGFSLIYPGTFKPSELKKLEKGDFHYSSWDGSKNAAGRYGYWYAPGNFDQFTYTWILPQNAELLRYRSNKQGTWTRRGNAISFYAEQVNNLTFDIRYRLKKAPQKPDKTSLKTAAAKPQAALTCPEPKIPEPVIKTVRVEVSQACPEPPPAKPCECQQAPPPVAKPAATKTFLAARSDSDKDGISDALDLCPGTPIGAKTDRAGCELDTDKDGVFDGLDQCIATPEDTRVDQRGCALGQTNT